MEIFDENNVVKLETERVLWNMFDHVHKYVLLLVTRKLQFNH